MAAPCNFLFLQERVEQLLQSCHFNPEWLAAPLTEAAGRGHVEVTQAGHVEVTFADLAGLKKEVSSKQT